MEMSIRTMMVIVIGVIAALMLIVIFSGITGEGNSMIQGLFDWFRILGGGGN